ncbi:MAG TPA: hypothetical protein PKC21_06400 [Oligoflexia bacterium]|nr:hypothetical protein [Oligoflexia bacterium]HMR24965.1 hypothetical protein [Oligoflexia bacterium]
MSIIDILFDVLGSIASDFPTLSKNEIPILHASASCIDRVIKQIALINMGEETAQSIQIKLLDNASQEIKVLTLGFLPNHKENKKRGNPLGLELLTVNFVGSEQGSEVANIEIYYQDSIGRQYISKYSVESGQIKFPGNMTLESSPNKSLWIFKEKMRPKRIELVNIGI